jgi:hypothetical protein
VYPRTFSNSPKYVLIESNNIGLFLYSRIIYSFNSEAYQATVKSTYGVENSQTLSEWKKLVYVADRRDYGYG